MSCLYFLLLHWIHLVIGVRTAVSGTLYSTATLLGSTASAGSYLSGDAAYMDKRHTRRLKQQAKRGGALSGLKGGGASVVTGVASGE